jgi:transcriptional regulator with XRE-family HTH domain
MDGRSLLAWNIKRIRRQQGIPQDRLAADAGIDRAYVGSIERKRVSTSVDLIERLADALDVPMAELFLKPAPGAKLPKPLPVGRKKLDRRPPKPTR